MSRLSRRELLSGSAGVAGGAVAVGLGLAAAAPAGTSPSAGSRTRTAPDAAVDDRIRDGQAQAAVEPFHGHHQSGIATPAQAHASFLGLDLRPGTDRSALVRMLTVLTDDATRLTQGRPALGDTEPELAEQPARLTVTFGMAPRVFDVAGVAGRRPQAVQELPEFRTDALRPEWGQSDLLLQVCTDSPVTLAHTVRMLVKDARSFATVRWAQRGFTSPGATDTGTARNLMGQVDGTVNPVPGTAEFAGAVWAAGGGTQWFTGGTVLVLRRIMMDLEAWDAFERPGKEQVIGRRLDTGAPLTGTAERDEPDLDAVDASGFPVIEPNAHIRLARARPGEMMLRRPYSYDEGMDAQGRPDAGLLFAAYQADPARAFVPVQARLAEADLFNRWITHIGSAVYAIPPGVAEGEYWAQPLLEG